MVVVEQEEGEREERKEDEEGRGRGSPKLVMILRAAWGVFTLVIPDKRADPGPSGVFCTAKPYLDRDL